MQGVDQWCSSFEKRLMFTDQRTKALPKAFRFKEKNMFGTTNILKIMAGDLIVSHLLAASNFD
jgi:hypothetical protein